METWLDKMNRKPKWYEVRWEFLEGALLFGSMVAVQLALFNLLVFLPTQWG